MVLLFTIIAIAAVQLHIAFCSSSTSSFTLQPLNLQSNFVLQSLVNPFRYPIVTPQGEIFLTQAPSDSSDRNSKTLYNVGRITYNHPLPIKDDSNQLLSFTTSFTFNITTSTKYNESGDGIAFVMTTDQAPPPNSTGRYLGLMPKNPQDRHQRFIALEFDTFQNLQAEILDPSASHIGIDISSLASIKPVLNTADPSHPLYLYNNYTITAWLGYDASTHLIQVWATNTSSHDSRPPIPILSTFQNLSQVFEHHASIYVGITAASGNNSQATILYSWNFSIVEEQKSTSSTHLAPVLVIIIPVLSVTAIALTIAVAVRVLCQNGKSVADEEKARHAIGNASVSVHPYRFNKLKKASGNFSEEQMLGRGASSTVYKGVLRNGTIVAIKKMKDGLEAEAFMREVQIMSKFKHPNLLELEGYCYERGRREALLVYRYMPKGSLQSYLYGDRRRSGEWLGIEARFKIILGVAAGLEYLHHGLDKCILHRDVKPANVLLTETMEAKVGDFGLARLIPHDEIVTCSRAAGTLGYMAPEVFHTRRVTEKADVYSFGVLALVVACGRPPLDATSSPSCSNLVDWVSQHTDILDALDPLLSKALVAGASHSSSTDHVQLGANNVGEISAAYAGVELANVGEKQKWRCVLRLGLLCCQTEPEDRPCMTKVHQALRDCIVSPLPDPSHFYPAVSTLPIDTDVEVDPTTSVLEPLEFLEKNLGLV